MQTKCSLQIADHVLIQAQIQAKELQLLKKEFPDLHFTKASPPHPPFLLNKTLVFYGNQLSKKDLAQMNQLRWIHCNTPLLSSLPLDELNEISSIIITRTPCEDTQQIKEYVMGALLGFAKRLFFWTQDMGKYRELWGKQKSSFLEKPVWEMTNKKFLQIGLGQAGTEIAAGAASLGMHVWGCDRRGSFRPHCHKLYPITQLHSLLPATDVVSLCMPRAHYYTGYFGKEQLELMRDDTILIIVGSGGVTDEQALAEAAPRLRGIILDSFCQSPLSSDSPLWNQENIFITPEISNLPTCNTGSAFYGFRHNLRHFVKRNTSDIDHVVERPLEEVFL